jgi:hypothetical protein
MLASSCAYCLELLAEMRSAIMETNAILDDIRARRRAGNWPGAHAQEWWQRAQHRWVDASTDFTTHIATHPIAPFVPSS